MSYSSRSIGSSNLGGGSRSAASGRRVIFVFVLFRVLSSSGLSSGSCGGWGGSRRSGLGRG